MLNQDKYIRYAAEFAAANATHIRLGGSFQKGTASPYSDVDISVSGDVRHVKRLIYGYGKPVFLSHTTNPLGILIVIYEDGVQVDLEVVSDVMATGEGYFHTDDIGAVKLVRNETIFRELVSRDDEPYQISRLFHRSLIKYLSGKEDAGVSVGNEIAAFLQSGEKLSKENYRNGMRKLLDRFSLRHIPWRKHTKGSFGKCSPAIGALFRSPSADISWPKATAGSCSFSGAGGVTLTPLRILRIAG